MPADFSNIDRFNLTAVKLFDRLYDEFPNPIDIETVELGIQASPDETSVAESVRFAVYAESAVSWLVTCND